jgi:hypothetical protein
VPSQFDGPMRLRSAVALGGLATAILIGGALGARQNESSTDCLVSRVGPFRFEKHDVEMVRAQLRLPRSRAQQSACWRKQRPAFFPRNPTEPPSTSSQRCHVTGRS